MGQKTLFDPLFPPEKRTISRGPVYQGVAKQIRELIGDGTIDKGKQAGSIAQARSLAHTIDLKSGLGGVDPEYGASIAAMHKQLDELLVRLSGDDLAVDPFDDLLDEMQNVQRVTDAG